MAGCQKGVGGVVRIVVVETLLEGLRGCPAGWLLTRIQQMTGDAVREDLRHWEASKDEKRAGGR